MNFNMNDDIRSYMVYLEELRARSIELGIPAIDPEDGYVLHTLTLTLRNLDECPIVFEAGSGIGYSTLWIATALKQISSCGAIIASEYDPEKLDILINTFKKLKLENTIIPKQGDSVKIAETIDRELDMVFIDIEKHRYIEFFEIIKDKVKVGGIVTAHNIYKPDPDAGRRYIDHLRKYSKQWIVSTIPTNAGLNIAIKIKK